MLFAVAGIRRDEPTPCGNMFPKLIMEFEFSTFRIRKYLRFGTPAFKRAFFVDIILSFVISYS